MTMLQERPTRPKRVRNPDYYYPRNVEHDYLVPLFERHPELLNTRAGAMSQILSEGIRWGV